MLVIPLLLAGSLAAQNSPPSPCAAPEFRQFDFWVGEWELSWPASPATQGAPGRAASRIESTLDKCVIMEHFDGGPAIPLRGMSVSTFNLRKHQWQQTWVDNSGGYLDFVGGFKNGQMILSRHATRNGKTFLQRMVWKNIEPGSLDWKWERSDDGGRTWTVLWPIHYRRKD
jgi:hypothetical protein